MEQQIKDPGFFFCGSSIQVFVGDWFYQSMDSAARTLGRPSICRFMWMTSARTQWADG